MRANWEREIDFIAFVVLWSRVLMVELGGIRTKGGWELTLNLATPFVCTMSTPGRAERRRPMVGYWAFGSMLRLVVEMEGGN